MPVLDFPPNPLAGAIYPVPPLPNQPVYTFDGIKWTTLGDVADDIVGASTTLPLMDGAATVGVQGAWSRGDHVHPTDTTRAPITSPTFLVDAKAPTPASNSNSIDIATTAFVTTAIAASPAGSGAAVDAMAPNGIQINGSFDVNQEKPQGGVTSTDGGYICDGWKLGKTGTMVVQAATGFDAAIKGAGLASKLIVDVTTGQTSLGASDVLYVAQPIEGTRISRLAWGTSGAQSITIGFWSKNYLTGIYSVVVQSASGLSYAATYTQAASNTLQYNTIVIPGSTGGTWGVDVNTGLNLIFGIAAGTAKIATTANTWVTGTFYAAPGQINGAAAAAGNVLAITGVVVIPGVVTIPSSRSSLIMRPYGEELATCQRYFQILRPPKNVYVFLGIARSSVQVLCPIRFPTMRGIPVISLNANTDFAVNDPATSTAVVTGVTFLGDVSAGMINFDCSGLQTTGHSVWIEAIGNSSTVMFDARL